MLFLSRVICKDRPPQNEKKPRMLQTCPHRDNRTLLPILLLLFLLSGCATGAGVGPLPEGLRIQTVSTINPRAAVAWSPDGRRVALTRKGLRIVDSHDQSEQKIDQQSPLFISWHPNNNSLYAAFADGTNSQLRKYRIGEKGFTELTVNGRIVWLDPAPGTKIHFATIVVKNYSFGSNYQQILYSWEEGKAPVPSPLVNTTLKPLTQKRLQDDIYKTAHISIAPLKDEVLFARLHDPPMIDPFFKLVLKNLATGKMRVLAEINLSSDGGLLVDDGEKVLFGDGFSQTKLISPYRKNRLQSWPLSGRSLAVSASGKYLFSDGVLFSGNEKIAKFPKQSTVWFSPLGDSLLLAADKRLYLISGLSDQPSAMIDQNQVPTLLNLRRWRSEGLIDDIEYQTSRQRLLR